jgi:hypothetical protein
VLVQDIDNLEVLGIDARVSRIGVELRAEYGLRTPVALQIASCLAYGATAFLVAPARRAERHGAHVASRVDRETVPTSTAFEPMSDDDGSSKME